MSKKNNYKSNKTFIRDSVLEPEAIKDDSMVEQEMASPVEELIDFDGWWASRQSKIPPQHRKEIIKADFRGRGLSVVESMNSFDKALKAYGIKLD